MEGWGVTVLVDVVLSVLTAEHGCVVTLVLSTLASVAISLAVEGICIERQLGV